MEGRLTCTLRYAKPFNYTLIRLNRANEEHETNQSNVSHSKISPSKTLQRPKKRTCPSLSRIICANVRFQPLGDKKGIKPSMTKTKASAAHNVSLLKIYFLTAAPAADPLPRMALKNSEELGSSTKTSLFLLKLAL